MGLSPETIPSGQARNDWNSVSMKLTRLRLLGFKSFVEPTDFMIEPGLTGVVGPNGCASRTWWRRCAGWSWARPRTSRCAPPRWTT